MIDIANLPGISKIDVKSLNSLGINTNLELLKFTKDEKSLPLALKIGVNQKNVLKWIALADLSRVKSVGNKYCGLILHSGIISTQQLSQVDASKLHTKVMKLQIASFQRKDLCPSIGLVQTWIKEAKIINS